jgi:hypothetical protein
MTARERAAWVLWDLRVVEDVDDATPEQITKVASAIEAAEAAAYEKAAREVNAFVQRFALERERAQASGDVVKAVMREAYVEKCEEILAAVRALATQGDER